MLANGGGYLYDSARKEEFLRSVPTRLAGFRSPVSVARFRGEYGAGAVPPTAARFLVELVEDELPFEGLEDPDGTESDERPELGAGSSPTQPLTAVAASKLMVEATNRTSARTTRTYHGSLLHTQTCTEPVAAAERTVVAARAVTLSALTAA